MFNWYKTFVRKKLYKPNPYQLLVDEIFGKQIIPSIWNVDEYTLSQEVHESICPKALTMAGWRVIQYILDLPTKPGVYIIHSGREEDYGSCLYVGQTSNLYTRFVSSLRQPIHPQWRKAIKSYPSPLVFFWTFDKISTRELLTFEAYMIGLTRPLWNFGEVEKYHEQQEKVPIEFDDIWNISN